MKISINYVSLKGQNLSSEEYIEETNINSTTLDYEEKLLTIK